MRECEGGTGREVRQGEEGTLFSIWQLPAALSGYLRAASSHEADSLISTYTQMAEYRGMAEHGLDGLGSGAYEGEGSILDLLVTGAREVESWGTTRMLDQGFNHTWPPTAAPQLAAPTELADTMNGTESGGSDLEYYSSFFLEGVLLPIIALFGIFGEC